MILLSMTICIDFLMIWKRTTLQKQRERNRDICFHAKNPDKIISARGEFQKIDSFIIHLPLNFSGLCMSWILKNPPFFFTEDFFIAVVYSTSTSELLSEIKFLCPNSLSNHYTRWRGKAEFPFLPLPFLLLTSSKQLFVAQLVREGLGW